MLLMLSKRNGRVATQSLLETYLSPHLIHDMAARNVSNLVRVPHSDIKAWPCCLLETHAGLSLSAWALHPLRRTEMRELLLRTERGPIIVSSVRPIQSAAILCRLRRTSSGIADG